jgi:hypothetical protein
VAVLNDCSLSYLAWSDLLSRIDGPVSTFQLRQVAAMLATANTGLLVRPEFGTAFNPILDTVRLYAIRPAPEFAPFDPLKLGETLAFVLREHIPHLSADEIRDPEEVEALIRSGRLAAHPVRMPSTGIGRVEARILRAQHGVSHMPRLQPDGDQAVQDGRERAHRRRRRRSRP